MGTSDLIRSYYHQARSNQTDHLIGQLDALGRLALGALGADFVGLYFRENDGQNLIPVAYSGSGEINVKNLESLVVYWSERAKKAESLGENEWSGSWSADDASATDSFGQMNGFEAGFRYPISVKGKLGGAAVVYWKTEPTESSHEQIESALCAVCDILVVSLKAANDMRTLNGFYKQVPELVAMLETPLGEFRFGEMVALLMRSISLVEHLRFAYLLSFDWKTDGYRYSGHSGGSEPPWPLIERTIAMLPASNSPSDSPVVEERPVCDLSMNLDDGPVHCMLKEILPEQDHRFAIVVSTSEPSGFSDGSRHLFYGICTMAQTVLRNALLVRRLRKSNRLLKRAAVKMANMESLAAMADMTSGLAHEFNNLIGGVVGRIQLMRMKKPDEDFAKELAKIEELAMEGAKTVKRIQEFSLGARYKHLEPVNLYEIVKGSVNFSRATWRKLADSKSITVSVTCSEEEAVIEGAFDDLMTVMHKLIENAVEHSPENEEVAVTLKGDSNFFNIEVSDRGPGIAPALRKKIFYPFFSTKQLPTAGLSLATVHGVILRHGAHIEFHPQSQGPGTVFRLSFRRHEEIEEITEITRKSPSHGGRNRILVVDDDDQIREILHDMLSMEGHIAVTCKGGEEALLAIKREEFDLMITDLGMPGMSGLELASTVHKAQPELPIAMITGWGTQLDQDEVSRCGVCCVLSKPFHFQDIRTLVEDLICSRAEDSSKSHAKTV